MTSSSVKASGALEKPPTAKPLRSRRIPDGNPKRKLDAIFKALSKSLKTSNQNY